MAQKKYFVAFNQQAVGDALPSTPIEAAKQTGTIKVFPPVLTARVTEVEAESAEEAITGLREVFPGNSTGKAYIVEKNKGEEK